MALTYKPHTASVQTATQKVTSNDVDGRTLAIAVDVACQITPGKAVAIYEQFNIQLTAPYELLCELEHEALFTIGTEVEWGGTKYYVKAWEPWNAIASISCLRVVMEREKQ